MESLVEEHGQLAPTTRPLSSCRLAKKSNITFGATAGFTVAREFLDAWPPLRHRSCALRCGSLFVSLGGGWRVSRPPRKARVHRIAQAFESIDAAGYSLRLRVRFAQFLPRLARPARDESHALARPPRRISAQARLQFPG